MCRNLTFVIFREKKSSLIAEIVKNKTIQIRSVNFPHQKSSITDSEVVLMTARAMINPQISADLHIDHFLNESSLINPSQPPRRGTETKQPPRFLIRLLITFHNYFIISSPLFCISG